MFWERFTIQQMSRFINRPESETASGHYVRGRSSGDRFGLCPNCHAFVKLGPVSDPPADEPCPVCQRPIRDLNTLGDLTSD